MITAKELEQELSNTGALLKGHFLLSSGKHSAYYLQCARLLQHPALAERIGTRLAEEFGGERIDAVVAPAIGGLIIGHEAAKALDVPFVFTEREDGKMTFRRGLLAEKGWNVLAVEDVITTGGSVKEAIAVVRESGANVIGVGSIIDRSRGDAEFDVPFKALLSVDFPVYDPDNLPEELRYSTPIKPGSRYTAD